MPLFGGSLPTSGTLADDLKAALSRMQAAKGLPADVSYILFAEIGQPLSAYKFRVENTDDAHKTVDVLLQFKSD